MSTNFFEQQATAKKSTTWLLVMFCLATVAIVVTVSVVVALAVSATPVDPSGQAAYGEEQSPWAIAALAGVGTLLLILGGSFFKILALRAGGGASVAESLGGVRLYPNTTDLSERRLLNVVEEMSIASGVPVPPVYLLKDEAGINAFAAGYSPSDAVLGITRGAVEQLTRDELQGVLAHEFSHILNGDMRIGIRVMGVLYGILLMGFVGQLIFRTMAYSGRSRSNQKGGNNGVMVILLIGVALIVLGFVGTLLGNLIKAAISRQRERLADASGVQFTRNPAGLAGALKRIGAAQAGSQLQAPNAAQASHILFAEGVWKNMSGLWSSHPPLAERIRALDPTWDGVYPAAGSNAGVIAREISASASSSRSAQKASPGFSRTSALAAGLAEGSTAPPVATEVPLPVVDRAVEHVGKPTQAHVNYASDLWPLLPDSVADAVREPYAARAVVLALLLHQDATIRAHQFQSLSGSLPRDVVRLIEQLAPVVDALDTRVRLPLVDLALPALSSLSPTQYQQFIKAFRALAAADEQLDLFEWVLSQIVIRHLQPHFGKALRASSGRLSLQRLAEPCAVVLSAIAYAGNSDEKARQAFAAAAAQLPNVSIALLARPAAGLPQLRQALNAVAQATSRGQGALVDAAAASISADGHATIEEVELLRGISDLLGCPMPPLLVEQD